MKEVSCYVSKAKINDIYIDYITNTWNPVLAC